MANTTITPNMNLIIPTPGQDPGPDYANNNNQDFVILDGHNHSPGSGVPVTPAGLDISTNLSFQNNNAENVYGIQFSAPAPDTTDLSFLYTAPQTGGGIYDLFYNDGAGNVIALTKAGEVNATIASLPGESYAGGTFTWKQGAGSTTPANFDIGSITIRPNIAATTFGVVVNPPSAISSQYDIQLPIVPSVTSIMQLDPSGNMIATLVPDNSTIVISSQVLQVPAQGITATQIANGTITTTQISNTAGITGQQLAPVNYVVSGSCGNFTNSGSSFIDVTNLNVDITTTGKAVILMAVAVNGSGTLQSSWTSEIAISELAILRDGSYMQIYTINSSTDETTFIPSILIYDYSVIGAPGTYHYDIQVNPNGGVTGINNYVIIAKEDK